jgi:hypothetical protein
MVAFKELDSIEPGAALDSLKQNIFGACSGRLHF